MHWKRQKICISIQITGTYSTYKILYLKVYSIQAWTKWPPVHRRYFTMHFFSITTLALWFKLCWILFPISKCPIDNMPAMVGVPILCAQATNHFLNRVNQFLCRHMASLGHNYLLSFWVTLCLGCVIKWSPKINDLVCLFVGVFFAKKRQYLYIHIKQTTDEGNSRDLIKYI